MYKELTFSQHWMNISGTKIRQASQYFGMTVVVVGELEDEAFEHFSSRLGTWVVDLRDSQEFDFEGLDKILRRIGCLNRNTLLVHLSESGEQKISEILISYPELNFVQVSSHLQDENATPGKIWQACNSELRMWSDNIFIDESIIPFPHSDFSAYRSAVLLPFALRSIEQWPAVKLSGGSFELFVRKNARIIFQRPSPALLANLGEDHSLNYLGFAEFDLGDDGVEIAGVLRFVSSKDEKPEGKLYLEETRTNLSMQIPLVFSPLGLEKDSPYSSILQTVPEIRTWHFELEKDGFALGLEEFKGQGPFLFRILDAQGKSLVADIHSGALCDGRSQNYKIIVNKEVDGVLVEVL